MSQSFFDHAAASWDDQPHRVRLMKAIGEAIVHQAAPTAERAVLDYGCGTGLVGLYLLPYVRSVIGADSSLGMLDVLGKKIAEDGLSSMRTVHLDLEKEAVLADRFQMIVVGMAMHHIADTDRVMRAFHKMLLPGGILCIADLDTELGNFHSASAAAGVHHHGFDRQEMKSHLMEIGFINVADSTVARFSKPIESGGQAEFSIFLITAKRS